MRVIALGAAFHPTAMLAGATSTTSRSLPRLNAAPPCPALQLPPRRDGQPVPLVGHEGAAAARAASAGEAEEKAGRHWSYDRNRDRALALQKAVVAAEQLSGRGAGEAAAA